MRITIILGPFYPVPTVLGGAVEKVQLALASCYATAGHHVTVVSRQFGEFALRGTQEGVHHIRIPSFDRHGSLAMNLLLGFFYDLRAALAMPTSDITVTNSFFLPLVLYRRKAGKIYVHAARYPKGQFSLYRRADRIQAVSMAVANAVTAQAPRLAGKVVVIGNPLPDNILPVSQTRQRNLSSFLSAGWRGKKASIFSFVHSPPWSHKANAGPNGDCGSWGLINPKMAATAKAI